MKQTIAEQTVASRLSDAHFDELSLADLNLPRIEHTEMSDGTDVPYAVFGNQDTEQLVFAISPYGCRVSDESQLVRLKAQQLALGDDACVVGLHVYDTAGLKLPASERDEVSGGSFRPYADRVLSVIEALDPRDDQQISLYGFSMGADVSIETVYQVVTDAQRGVVPIDRLGAIEPARSVKRGAFAVMNAFKNSGPDLYDNVIASASPALLEARDIDPDDPKAQKRHDARVAWDVMKANVLDVRGGIAHMRGFANDNSLQQLNELIELDVLPQTSIGRASESTICPPAFLSSLRPSDRVDTFTLPGDHSLADNIRMGAAMMVRAVLL